MKDAAEEKDEWGLPINSFYVREKNYGDCTAMINDVIMFLSSCDGTVRTTTTLEWCQVRCHQSRSCFISFSFPSSSPSRFPLIIIVSLSVSESLTILFYSILTAAPLISYYVGVTLTMRAL